MIQLDLARHVTARVGILQIHFEDRGRTQAHEVAVALWKHFFGLLIVSEILLESRAGQPVSDATGEISQVEAFACWICRAKQALQSPLQVLRADQERLGLFFAGFNEANGGTRRQSREEVLLRASSIKFQATIEFQHGERIALYGISSISTQRGSALQSRPPSLWNGSPVGRYVSKLEKAP